jgi:hypothetical protein
MLGLNTDTTTHPTEAARDLIGVLASAIAQTIDPMGSIAVAARIVRDAQAGVELTRAGNTLPLPGMGTHPLLDPGSAVLAAAGTEPAAHLDFATFLCPYREGGEPGQVRITVLSSPNTRHGTFPGWPWCPPPATCVG